MLRANLEKEELKDNGSICSKGTGMERRMGEVYGKTYRKAKQSGFGGIQASSKLEWEMQESHNLSSMSVIWWCMLMTPALRRSKQGDCELVCIVEVSSQSSLSLIE